MKMLVSPSRLLAAATVALVCAAATHAADEAAWTEDMDAAMLQAKAQNKDLLVDFTGSDWCPPCMALGEEVFDSEQFANGAANEFVLVKMDFPKQTQQDEKIKQQNAAWAQKFGVQNFPTVVLMEPSGRPYAAISGYQSGAKDQYLTALSQLQQASKTRQAVFAQAEKAEGAEKAKLLDQAVSSLQPQILLMFYRPEVDEIIALDADGSAGVKDKYETLLKVVEAEQDIQTQLQPLFQAGDADKVIAKIDELAAKYKNFVGIKIKLLMAKAKILAEQQHKFQESLDVIDQAIAIAPNPQLAENLGKLKAQLQQAIEQQKSQNAPADSTPDKPAEPAAN